MRNFIFCKWGAFMLMLGCQNYLVDKINEIYKYIYFMNKINEIYKNIYFRNDKGCLYILINRVSKFF